MPRSTLWLEEIRITNIGVIDTPLGRLTVRQAVGMGIFALFAWLLFQALPFISDIFLRVIPSLALFTFGAALSSWKVKTIPIERQLLLALGIGKKAHIPKPPHKKEGARVPARAEAPKKRGVRRAQATVGEPFKIVGILREGRFGKPLSNRNFEVYVDGKPLYKGASDGDGGFEAVYIPENPGVVKLEVRPEGYVEEGVVVEVVVSGVAPRE